MTPKKPAAGLKLDGYVRVSDTRDRDVTSESWITEDDQRDKVNRWAIGHGHEIIHWEKDLDVSGTKLSRPGFDRILERIRTKQTDGIVVAYLSRLSRAGVGDALKLIDEITTEHGAVLGCYSPQIDTNDPVMGRFVLTLFLALNAMESARIGANWDDAKTRAIKRGVFVGPCPFGYRKIDGGRLEVDPITGPFVTEIYERRAAGQSWSKISGWLRENNVRTGAGKTFGHSKLSQLLLKRVYLGEQSNVGLGICNKNSHPPLTTEATWQAARDARGPRFTSTIPRDDLLLRGLIRCAGCRYMMQGANLRGDLVYRCSRHSNLGGAAGDCTASVQISAADGPRITGIHSYVMEQVIARSGDLVARAYGADSEADDVRAASEEARELLISHATDFALEKSVGREAFLARGEVLRAAVMEAEEAERDFMRTNAGRMAQPLRRLSGDITGMSVDEQRELLSSAIQCVFVRRGELGQHTSANHGTTGSHGASAQRVHIVWRDDPPVDIPRQGYRKYVLHPFVFPGDDPADVREALA